MTKGLPLSGSSQSLCSRRRRARQRDQRHVVDRLAVIAGEDERRASRLADGFERGVTEWNDEDVRAMTEVLHLLGRTAPDARLEVDLVEAHEASGTGARGRQSDEPEAARSGRVDRLEGAHELGHSPEVEGRDGGHGRVAGSIPRP